MASTDWDQGYARGYAMGVAKSPTVWLVCAFTGGCPDEDCYTQGRDVVAVYATEQLADQHVARDSWSGLYVDSDVPMTKLREY